MPVAERKLRRRQGPKLPFRCQDVHGVQHILHLRAIRTRIHRHRTAEGARDAAECLHTAELLRRCKLRRLTEQGAGQHTEIVDFLFGCFVHCSTVLRFRSVRRHARSCSDRGRQPAKR